MNLKIPLLVITLFFSTPNLNSFNPSQIKTSLDTYNKKIFALFSLVILCNKKVSCSSSMEETFDLPALEVITDFPPRTSIVNEPNTKDSALLKLSDLRNIVRLLTGPIPTYIPHSKEEELLWQKLITVYVLLVYSEAPRTIPLNEYHPNQQISTLAPYFSHYIRTRIINSLDPLNAKPYCHLDLILIGLLLGQLTYDLKYGSTTAPLTDYNRVIVICYKALERIIGEKDYERTLQYRLLTRQSGGPEEAPFIAITVPFIKINLKTKKPLLLDQPTTENFSRIVQNEMIKKLVFKSLTNPNQQIIFVNCKFPMMDKSLLTVMFLHDLRKMIGSKMQDEITIGQNLNPVQELLVVTLMAHLSCYCKKENIIWQALPKYQLSPQQKYYYSVMFIKKYFRSFELNWKELLREEPHISSYSYLFIITVILQDLATKKQFLEKSPTNYNLPLGVFGTPENSIFCFISKKDIPDYQKAITLCKSVIRPFPVLIFSPYSLEIEITKCSLEPIKLIKSCSFKWDPTPIKDQEIQKIDYKKDELKIHMIVNSGFFIIWLNILTDRYTPLVLTGITGAVVYFVKKRVSLRGVLIFAGGIGSAYLYNHAFNALYKK